jgi:hypothetical protein
MSCATRTRNRRLSRAASSRRFFEKYISSKENDCWSPEFPDGGGCNVFIDVDPEIESFSVSHSPASPELWDCLFEVLRQTGCFLCWPDGQAVVANPAVLGHLNAGLLDLFGPGIVVQNGKDIFDAIDRETDVSRASCRLPLPASSNDGDR